MTLTIKLPDEDLQALRAKAAASGMSEEQYALQVLEQDLAPGWLRQSWASAKESGAHELSAEEIDAEIAAARKARRERQTTPSGRMTRIVLDTNIVVSALLQPLGPPPQIFLLALGGSLAVCISGEIFAEYEEVIRRPRFCFDARVVTAALEAIRAKAHWVKPAESVRACPDSDDDIFLECAQAARAPYLVTGNPKHFPSVWRDTQIVTPRQFFQIITRALEPEK